jgi:hypothetical protein
VRANNNSHCLEEVTMLGVVVTISRYVSGSQPGWVECKLVDAHGNESTIMEKVPVVTLADLDANSSYPQTGYLACQVVERRVVTNGAEVVTIDIGSPWGVEDTSGKTQFDVFSNQLTTL